MQVSPSASLPPVPVHGEVLRFGLELEIDIVAQKTKSKKERREEYEQALSTVQETQRRIWMERHGKSRFVKFNDT
ncbi:MAG: hypothetical protein P4M11_14270 [Candidatus Pacebacteria bacterium]|nr:hypothetical protein [Candidatus Paceibacterota bacterium]